VGQLIDLAVLWGINKPTTWGEAVFTGAGKSGHYVIQGTNVDLGQDVAKLAQQMALTGYTVNGFAAMPGMSWQLVGMRSAQGVPIYQPDMTDTPGGTLYGYDMSEVNNGSWQMGLTGAVMLCGDFTKSIIGMRRDITFKMFTEGVISDDTGKVILNLMQQDSVAMRMTMRLAYATVNPVTIMQPSAVISGTNPQRWPYGAVLPVGATAPTAAALNVIQAPPYPYTGSFAYDPTEAELDNPQETESAKAHSAAQEANEREVSERTRARSRAPRKAE